MYLAGCTHSFKLSLALYLECEKAQANSGKTDSGFEDPNPYQSLNLLWFLFLIMCLTLYSFLFHITISSGTHLVQFFGTICLSGILIGVVVRMCPSHCGQCKRREPTKHSELCSPLERKCLTWSSKTISANYTIKPLIETREMFVSRKFHEVYVHLPIKQNCRSTRSSLIPNAINA
ncbi:unnamed protein product [Brassica oleracea]